MDTQNMLYTYNEIPFNKMEQLKNKKEMMRPAITQMNFNSITLKEKPDTKDIP